MLFMSSLLSFTHSRHHQIRHRFLHSCIRILFLLRLESTLLHILLHRQLRMSPLIPYRRILKLWHRRRHPLRLLRLQQRVQIVLLLDIWLHSSVVLNVKVRKRGVLLLGQELGSLAHGGLLANHEGRGHVLRLLHHLLRMHVVGWVQVLGDYLRLHDLLLVVVRQVLDTHCWVEVL